MTQGGKKLVDQGFTVVETMVVLAVTSLIFLSAAIFISGKQATTEFTVGIRQIQQSIQQNINEAQSGHYSNVGDFDCSDGASLLSIRSSGTTALGTNGECVFVGEAIVAQTGSGYNGSLLAYALGASRVAVDASTSPYSATNSNLWKVTALARGVTTNTTSPAGMAQGIALPDGITYVGGDFNGSTLGPSTLGFALLSNGNNYSDSVPATAGAQVFTLYGLSSIGSGKADSVADSLNVSPSGAAYNVPIQSVQMCFASGGTKQSGLITIGGPNGGTAVTLNIKTGNKC